MANKIEVQILGDSRQFQRALGQASSAGGKFGSNLARIGKLAAAGIAIAGAASAAAGAKMIGLASDAEEVDSKFRVVFGRTVPRLTKQINAFAKATGASRFELKEQVADLGALIKPIVGNTREAGKMSVAVAKLATDLGSFNNVPVEEALLAIRSGLVGEAEPLRRFGVLLNEAAVQSEALRLGLVKQGEELTEAQKVQARYSLIMKQTTLAQGDAERTSGSFANQLKRLKNGIRDAATSIGEFLLPMATAVINSFNDVIPRIQGFIDELGKAKGFKAKFNVVWLGVRGQVEDLWDTIRDFFLGSIERKPLALETGQIIEWETTKNEGLVKAIENGLRNADWRSVGKTIGENISTSIRITGDFLRRAFREFSTFVDENSDELADIGAKIGIAILAKLLDPRFWFRNWEAGVAVGLAVFPIGRFATLGFRAAQALLRPFAKLVKSTFGPVVREAVDAAAAAFVRLPGIVQAAARLAAQGARAAFNGLRGFLAGAFKQVLDRIPFWLKAAFRLTFWLTFISAIRSGWEKITAVTRAAVDKLSGYWDRIRHPLETIRGVIQGIYEWLKKLKDTVWSISIDWPSPPGWLRDLGGLIPGRQHGGPVQAGRAFMVGEAGPELFVPNTSGRIIPNGRFAAAGGGPVVIIENHGTIVGPDQLEAVVRKAVETSLRRGGRGLR